MIGFKRWSPGPNEKGAGESHFASVMGQLFGLMGLHVPDSSLVPSVDVSGCPKMHKSKHYFRWISTSLLLLDLIPWIRQVGIWTPSDPPLPFVWSGDFF